MTDGVVMPTAAEATHLSVYDALTACSIMQCTYSISVNKHIMVRSSCVMWRVVTAQLASTYRIAHLLFSAHVSRYTHYTVTRPPLLVDYSSGYFCLHAVTNVGE